MEMTGWIEQIGPLFLGLSFAIVLLSGFVKGAVGFAMPMIIISGLGSFLPPDTALAALILPTVLSNVMQALRGGLRAAWGSVRRFRVFIVTLLVVIALSAQLVALLPGWLMYLALGLLVTLFAGSQLAGWRPRLQARHRARAEVIMGAAAGLAGGVSGVWGPPTVAYLTTIDAPKDEQLRIQGVIYGAGAVVLLGAHLKSGVLNAQTLPLSLALVVPALLGMLAGFRLHDRLDAERFRRATLAVLVLAGLNLIRRGLTG